MKKAIQNWNENFWDKTQTKAIQGICAVGIIFHHMAQKTCAPWLPPEFISHGLDPFLNLGFIFVGLFFFCSGYGLFKSIKANPEYTKGFIGRHFRPIILLWLFSNYCFLMIDQETNHYCWFIYAILYLYLAFYISCKTCKSDRSRTISLGLFIILYIAICELIVAGTWTYNTIGIFLAGWLFAKFEEKIVACFRKNWWLWLIVTFAVFLGTFFAADIMSNAARAQADVLHYDLVRFSAVLVQFISALSFCVWLYVLSQRVRIKNKVCVFLGSMTLEIYLFHVLYVEIFSYYFVNPKKDAICYIPNVFLYALAVVSLSLLTAYALTWARKGCAWLYKKYNHIFTKMRRDFKKVAITIVSVLVGITALAIVIDKVKKPARQEMVDAYIAENIQFIPVEGKQMAVYTTGQGEQGVMFLRGFNVPCPTLFQRLTADEFAKDYKVVVPDFFGTGFSDDADTDRTARNICRELHEVARAYGLENYILVAEGISSMYAQYYVNAYPGEVSTVLTLDAEFTNLLRASLNAQNGSIYDYNRYNRRFARAQYALMNTVNSLGYKLFVWPWLLEMYEKGLGQTNVDLAYDVYFKQYGNAALKNERMNDYETYMLTENLKYPADVKVVDLVTEERRKDFETTGLNINDLLASICENPENQNTVITVNTMYLMCWKPETIKAQLSK